MIKKPLPSHLKATACAGALALMGTLGLLGSSALHADESGLPQYVIEEFGTPPTTPDGPLSTALAGAVDTAFGDNLKTRIWQPEQTDAIHTIAASGDARLAWLISDMMRIAASNDLNTLLSNAATELLGITYEDRNL